MISAPLVGCVWSNIARRASAGGQLEQPSEVNNSTRTGVRLGSAVCAAHVAGRLARAADRAATMAKQRSCDMGPQPFSYLEPPSEFKFHGCNVVRQCEIRLSVKQLGEALFFEMAGALGVYISVPFCKAKCTFCNFASGVFGAERMQQYVDRLCQEIRGLRAAVQNIAASLPRGGDTVYFGGGTPSLLS